MKKYIFGLVALVSTQFINAQITKNMGNFSSLKAYDKIPVQLIHSSSPSIEISGDKAEDVQVVNTNGELKIKMTSLNLLQGDNTQVKVYYDNLSNIQASQGAIISSQGALQSNKISLTANEGSVLNLELNTNYTEIKANTGGKIVLFGKSNNQTAVVNTGAYYDGEKLKTKSTSVSVNAGGEAKVYATESIDAKTRAGGNISVFGDPKDRNTKTVLGGKISFK
ncbi:head GIN domain-containing protein [Elizabethkingia sp. JS20170427COW]|uniref:head GIN domain-containing protein n=1 Tax=Elizabethkingia sp. JS20170427COW TaxID=2583851 RepID=UPI001110D6C9|nr:head GIN domain-containing protein [Elizabethkingia sp. JS20170427COW]QCX53831.1 DUF2807 domain-containing protein [Elizabethkingia sp. JS20170427COW]